VRSLSKAFGRGRFVMLHPGNRKVLAYVREYEDEAILCVANVSRAAQPVELELKAYKGRVPVEMMGRNAFPPVGELPYLLTLPAYGFFWFRLATDVQPPSWHSEALSVEDLPVLVLFDGWNSFFRGKVVPWRIGVAEKTRNQLERDLLPAFLQRQRWYAAKGEAIERAALVESVPLKAKGEQWLLALVEARTGAGNSRYFVPLGLAFEDRDEERTRALAALAVSRVRQQAQVGVLADAMADEPFCRALVTAIGAGAELRADAGSVHCVPGAAFAQVVGDATEAPLPLRRLTTSSNSVSLLGDKLFLKAYRHLHAGVNPELEMGRFLTDVVGFANCVAVAGSVEYRAADGSVWGLALLQEQVANQGDAWTFTVEQLARLLESRAVEDASLEDGIAAMAERMQVLARRVAELHVALARPTGDAAFDPEPMQPADVERWVRTVQDEGRDALRRLAQRREQLPDGVAPLVAQVLEAGPRLVERIEQTAGLAPVGVKTRIHGDLHLAQVLVQRDDFLLIDFEGEPRRSLDERRQKSSALRDVAGVLRSFDYARHTALQQTAQSAPDFERLAPIARRWERNVRDAFLATYAQVAVGGGLYADAAAWQAATPLRDAFELEKAFYELRYEMDNRPDWVGVPLAGIAALAGDAAA
jgi:maltose alpha-D-glucosyltransferase/alpha-amylase